MKSFLIALGTYLIFLATGAVMGYKATAQYYELQFKQREVEVLQELQRVKSEHYAKLSESTSNLLHELNRANDLARSRGADIERLRNANAKLQARTNASARSADAEALARCSELLTEGAGLVAEGEGLLLKHGAEHDALILLK